MEMANVTNVFCVEWPLQVDSNCTTKYCTLLPKYGYPNYDEQILYNYCFTRCPIGRGQRLNKSNIFVSGICSVLVC